MPENIFYGNDEAIELASDEFFPILEEHTSPKTGRVEQSGLVERRVDAARWRLHGGGLGFGDIELGRQYAGQLVRDCVEMQRDIAVKEQMGDIKI